MRADADESETSVSAETDRRDFPTPPRTLTDDDGRVLRFRAASESANERDSLAAMYDAFDSTDRAQGIPPASAHRRQQWLDRIAEGVAVVAWHEDRIVGHGVLLGEADHELALFVHPDYRRAGVGSTLLRTLLGRGRSAGVERVWLSVERANRPAVHLYRKAGFVPTETADVEMEMEKAMEIEMRRSLQ